MGDGSQQKSTKSGHPVKMSCNDCLCDKVQEAKLANFDDTLL